MRLRGKGMPALRGGGMGDMLSNWPSKRRSRHPHVRRARPCRRKLPSDADPQGFRVAVCEQMEDPAEAKKRGGSKAVVRREVVRLVTPGTLTEDALLDARTHNYLAAWAEIRGDGARLDDRAASCPAPPWAELFRLSVRESRKWTRTP
jgi:hypothetical protein